ncbi:SPOSA6832_02298, partial [Sporobolomyces salmonicolor]
MLTTRPSRTLSATSGEGQPEDEQAEDGQAFSLSPLVLAVTVDGQVHALKRETGQWVWTLHDDGGVALGGVGRGSKEERLRRTRAGDAVSGPLVKSVSRRKAAMNGRGGVSNETGVVPVETSAGDEGRDSETYIIEPTGDGDIYVYTRSSGRDGAGGLEKLPLSMAELVALSPFRFPGDSSRMFSASKHTKFVGVDLKTGRLVGVFGSNAGWCEWDEGDELSAGARRERDDEDCDEDIAKKPEDLLYMARTEYHLSIYSSHSSAPLQTLSYTTYSSSTFPSPPSSSASSSGFPTQASWRLTPDSLYLQPMHDGSLICFRAGQPGVHWSIDFETPVVGVFDVALPTSSASQQPTGLGVDDTAHPVMFEQPHPLLVPDLPLDFAVLQKEPAATFIGKIDARAGVEGSGELFAMSRDRFPLVPFAAMAQVAKAEMPAAAEEELPEEGDALADPAKRHESDLLIGRHRLRNPPLPSPIGLDSTLDPAPSSSDPLLIEAPPASAPPSPSPNRALPPTAAVDPTPNRRSPHYPGSSTLLASLYRSSVVRELGEYPQTGKMTLGAVLIVLIAWLWTRGKTLGGTKGEAKEEGAKTRRGRRRRKAPQQAMQTQESSDEQEEPQVPKPKPLAVTVAALEAAGNRLSGLRRRSPSTPPTPTSLAFTLSSSSSSSAGSSGNRGRASSLSLAPALHLVSPLKALPPLPPSGTLDPPSLLPSLPLSTDSTLAPAPPLDQGSPPLPSGVDDDGDSDSPPLGSTPTRKRGRRRRGKKTKKAAKEAGLDDELLPAGERGLEEITLGEREIGEGGSAQVDEEGRGVDGETVSEKARVGPQVVGGLSVSETILAVDVSLTLPGHRCTGYGSHGTVVLRGEFQGRAVAVKRLLKDFVTIATHEVALLQESDDHPHVIRYFCKEHRDTFLYIALELCPASLFDLIDQPSSFPALVAQLDPKKALRQVASGLRHLHSLKIVHRDIKPQNILVSTAKRGPGLRMLISDFGLCKKLDVDESSFQQTVNHAAGSFGYRAPEVLRGLVNPNETAAGATTPSVSVGSGGSTNTLAGSSSNGASTDPSLRLTRSIDIFSLGCIFYYVLTRGEHPFGGRYEREMNILQGKAGVERLNGLGEEAVEVQDLILRMVASDPRERPTAESVLLHPFFWNAQKRLLFICDASDRFEIMERDPPTPTLVTLERKAGEIVGDDWTKALDRTLLDNLGKYRKYDGASLRDLLRKHHYQDLPEPVRKNLGDLPGGFLSYFTTRFPHLLLHVYDTVATHLADEAMFASTFRVPEEEV